MLEEDITAKWFEGIVKKCLWLYNIEDPPESVLSLIVEDAIPKGFNYSGRLLRLIATIRHESGTTDEKSVVLKCTPVNMDQCTFISDNKLFVAETWTYDEVLSKMEYLMTQHGMIRELDWPRHFTICKENTLLLQDLKEQNYNTIKQREATYEEGVVVVQAIGRLHAMSLILISQRDIDTSHCKVNHMAENKTIIQFVYISSLKAIIDAIRSTKQEEWYTHADIVESNIDKLPPALKDVVTSSSGHNDVLNHGDCWLNNIMFKHCPETNQPEAIKLIDFQLGYYNSLAWDLVHFIYCSFLTDARERVKPSLISEYRKSLIQTLQKLKGQNLLDKVPTEEEILKSMDKLILFGLLVGLATVPRMVPDISSSLDLDITLPDQAHKAKTAVYSLPQVFRHLNKDLTHLSDIMKIL